jgi:hypothetical protein
MFHHRVIPLVALLAAGCGHALSAPMPDVKGTTEVFGLLGIWMAHGRAMYDGETKTQDARTHLTVDLHALTEQSLDELTRNARADRIAPAGAASAGSLEVVPFAVMTFLSPTRSRFWVGLKASLKGPDGKMMWKTRYHAGVGDDRWLTGAESWTSDDGTLVRETLRRNLRLALNALLKDVSGTLRQGAGRAFRVSAQWLWSDVTDDSVIAGVTILDKRAIVTVRSPSQ